MIRRRPRDKRKSKSFDAKVAKDKNKFREGRQKAGIAPGLLMFAE
jgi:hypothetical protein